MAYTSTYFDQTGEHIFRNNISEEEYEQVKENLQYLKRIMESADYYFIVCANIKEFLNDSQCNGINERDNFIRLNRHMMNWLNSFYAWIEYHERHYNNLFVKLKAQYYDTYFEYRLAYELRKYTTHQALCVNQISFDVLNEQTIYKIMIEDILDYGKEIKAQIRNESKDLRSNIPYIDAVKFVSGFSNMFKDFEKNIFQCLEDEFSTKFNAIIPFVQSGNHTILESYIESNERDECLDVGRRLLLCINKMSSLRNDLNKKL